MMPHAGMRLVCASAFSKADVRCVQICACSAQRTAFRQTAIFLSWVGNGWLYAGIAVPVLLGADSITVIWRPLLSVAVLHLVYRPLKSWLSRPRPYQVYPDLKPLLPALDEYSCPSGHAMTLTAVLLTLPAANGIVTSGCLLLWTAMAWARIAVAHHYPSDILAGAALAAIVALPISKI